MQKMQNAYVASNPFNFAFDLIEAHLFNVQGVELFLFFVFLLGFFSEELLFVFSRVVRAVDHPVQHVVFEFCGL